MTAAISRGRYLSGVNRINRIFESLRHEGRKAVMPFVTAGDPDVASLPALLRGAEAGGASVVEVGLPFSDPIADGPVIQASMKHALDHGASLDGVFEAVRSVRDELTLGLVAMVSYSIVHRRGLSAFVEQAASAGFDGFIFPDLPLEESHDARKAAADAGLILSQLVAPSTPIDRAKRIAEVSTGFVYVVSRAGITGTRAELPPELPARLSELRIVTDLPMAVGFGVSSAAHVAQVVSVADAAIVGSALVTKVAGTRGAPETAGSVVERFVGSLAEGLKGMPT
ncbi:MAG: tryptophan synthase subunit alpha [Planctomycetota bacterium]